MKFTVSSSAFSSRLALASKVLLAKNTMPILDCFLLDVRNGHVSITASDGEKYLVTSLPLVDSDNNARFCMTAAPFLNSTKELAEQPLTIEYNPENQEVRVVHKTGYFTLVGQTADTFPVMPPLGAEASTFTMSPETLLKGINLTLPATAEEELRMVMTGVCLDLTENSITFVATDGRKLVRYVNKEVHPGKTATVIVPKKVAQILRNIVTGDQDITISYDENRAFIDAGDTTFGFRIMEGKYLNYNAVIPAENPYSVTVDLPSLVSALKRVSVFCDPSTGLSKMNISNGTMTLTAQNLDYSQAAEDNLLCDYEGSPLRLGFNCNFMLSISTPLETSQVCLQLSDPSKPALILPVGENHEKEVTTILVMPMLLND